MNENFDEPILIAFDGPSASGKSTIAKKIAEYYILPYLNTGKIYRFIAFNLKKKYPKSNFSDQELEKICLELINEINKEDIAKNFSFNGEIESEECGQIASKISKFISVRKALEGLQRDFAFKNKMGAVLEGRDIGSIILPEANFKIFITASVEKRALRRSNQLNSSEQINSLTFDEIKKMIQERDNEDSSRDYAPLIMNPDSFLLDTTNLSFDDSIQEVKNYIELKKIMINASKRSNSKKENEEISKFSFEERGS